MKRLLICTILRNQRHNVDRWLSQIVNLATRLKEEWEVELVAYENESQDGTAEWLRNTAAIPSTLGISFPIMVATEILGTRQYGSVWDLQRLKQLANARQRCLDQVGSLDRFSKIAFIEPDVTYDPWWAKELVLARHPHAAGLGEPDIYSGWSLRTEANPKESVFLYDCCATRATKDDITWDFTERGGKWRGESLVRTDLGGHDVNCLHSVWSTFNCFCVYNARPFVEGAKWGWVNTRLNTGQEWIEDGDYGSGWLEADTSQMCETFRARGYDKVYLNTNVLVRHS